MSETSHISSIAQVLNAIAWPAVAIMAGFVFKAELKALLNRVRKGVGVEFDPPAPQTSTTSSSTDVAHSLNLPRTQATQELEKMIMNDPNIKSISEPEKREEAFVLMTARALLIIQFTQIEALIWGSQLTLLTYLNSKPDGEILETIKQHFYDPATKAFPEWYVNYPFESYLGFLQQNRMIEQIENKANITQQGVEYLTWRIEQRKPLKPFG